MENDRKLMLQNSFVSFQLFLTFAVICAAFPTDTMVASLALALAFFRIVPIARSECFLPEMKPPFLVGLSTESVTDAPTNDPTAAPTSAPTPSPVFSHFSMSTTEIEDEIEHLREWETKREEHLLHFYHHEDGLDDLIDCFSESISFNCANGPEAAALTVSGFRILANTYGDLITDYSVINGTAEYIDEDIIEMRIVEVVEADLGILSGALHWLKSLSQNGESDGKMEWITPMTVHWRIDDDGKIKEFQCVSPEWQRQIFGALLSIYVSTKGPIGDEMESTGRLTLFGYNYFVVMMIVSVSLMTTIIGLCVFVSVRCFDSRRSGPGIYNKVEVVTDVTDTEIE